VYFTEGNSEEPSPTHQVNMPTINVQPGADLRMQEIADIMGKSKKVVVVTGAGISTNCGIPVSCLDLFWP
jgi:accessory colonization factor AcfC